MKTPVIISIIVAMALVVSAFVFGKGGIQKQDSVPVNNVTIVDGKQIIEIKARGGYYPRKSIAKAGIPTILRFNSKGTFDCSASVRIPSLNISELLSQSGSTDIPIENVSPGVLRGSCGMGMYPFEIDFQD